MVRRKKVVVLIDFSEDSEHALDVALKIALRPESLFLVHVTSEPSVAGPSVIWDTRDLESLLQRMKEAFQKQFNDTKYQELHFMGLFGDPGHNITDYAKEIGAGLIVMPSHGRTGLKRMLIGSVAGRVVRLAHFPV